jgi:hypothetical protein
VGAGGATVGLTELHDVPRPTRLLAASPIAFAIAEVKRIGFPKEPIL